MGFSRQEYWSGLPFPSPGGSSQPRDWTQVSHIVGRCFYHLSHQGIWLSLHSYTSITPFVSSNNLQIVLIHYICKWLPQHCENITRACSIFAPVKSSSKLTNRLKQVDVVAPHKVLSQVHNSHHQCLLQNRHRIHSQSSSMNLIFIKTQILNSLTFPKTS